MLKTRLAGRLSLSRAEFRTKSDPRLAQMVHFSALCVSVDPDSSFKKCYISRTSSQGVLAYVLSNVCVFESIVVR